MRRRKQTSGAFNEMSMMHQYMGQDGSSFLLMTDASKGEPVMRGRECPAGTPVKQYRCLDDQYRDHVEPLARLLSGLYVCADTGYQKVGAKKKRTRRLVTKMGSILAP